MSLPSLPSHLGYESRLIAEQKTIQIERDMLSSFYELNMIEEGCSRSYEPGRYHIFNDSHYVCRRVANMMRVYNENVTYLNEHVSKDKGAAQNYSSGNWTPRTSDILNNCQAMLHLAAIHEPLKKRIEEVCSKMSFKDELTQKLSDIKLVKPEVTLMATIPIVRDSLPQSAPGTTAQTTSTSQNNSSRQELDVWIQRECVKQVKFGESLGICADPDWGAKPIAFTYYERLHQWFGKVPTGKKFKFVILQKDGIIQWESGNDRIIGSLNSELSKSESNSESNETPRFA